MYDRIKDTHGTSCNTIVGIAKRFVTQGMEAAFGRKKQENCHHKVDSNVKARSCLIIHGKFVKICAG